MIDLSRIINVFDRLLERARKERDSFLNSPKAGFAIRSQACSNLACAVLEDDREAIVSSVSSWASDRGLDLIIVTPGGHELGERIRNVVCYANDEYTTITDPAFLRMDEGTINRINSGRCVLLVRDLDLFEDLKYRRTIYDLINTHTLGDEKGTLRHLDNFLMAIATFGPKARIGLSDEAKDAFRILDLRRDCDKS